MCSDTRESSGKSDAGLMVTSIFVSAFGHDAWIAIGFS